MPTNWAWVRNVNGFANDWAAIKASGVKGVMLNPAEQPEADMARSYAAAKAAGLEVGIWDAPRNESATQFAQRMAGYSAKYHPTLLTLDVEAPGKGYPGSAGWQYSADLMRTFRALAGNQRTAVSMMPWQDDFNYKAYLDAGVTEFMPQAYGGGASGTESKYDPRSVRDRLIANGVPEWMINVTLAPGQSGAGLRDANFYTLDDIWASGGRLGFHWADGTSASLPADDAPPTAAPKPPTAAEKINPNTGREYDRYNEKAINYAKKRLAKLVELGILTEMPPGDPTAAWREASAKAYGPGGELAPKQPVGPLTTGVAPGPNGPVPLPTTQPDPDNPQDPGGSSQNSTFGGPPPPPQHPVDTSRFLQPPGPYSAPGSPMQQVWHPVDTRQFLQPNPFQAGGGGGMQQVQHPAASPIVAALVKYLTPPPSVLKPTPKPQPQQNVNKQGQRIGGK